MRRFVQSDDFIEGEEVSDETGSVARPTAQVEGKVRARGLKVGKEFACRRLESAGKDVKPALCPC